MLQKKLPYNSGNNRLSSANTSATKNQNMSRYFYAVLKHGDQESK